MKIFNKENNIDVVYVEEDDLLQMRCYYGSIPFYLEDEIKDALNGNNYNGEKFIRFTSPDALKLFESLKWIVDYKQCRNLTDEELGENFETLLNNREEIMNDSSYFGNINLTNNSKNKLLNYKVISLINYELVKSKQKTLPFPSVIDSDGKEFRKYRCVVNSCLDGDTFILRHLNNRKFGSGVKVPMEFINAIIPENAIGYTEFLTKDHKSIIIKFKYDKNYQKDYQLFSLARKNVDKLNW